MTKRDNHYEAAFEAYLRAEQAPYVAVDESRRSLSGGRSLKSLDFIVSPAASNGERPRSWLVDVKGRRFPSGGMTAGRTGQYWKNWTTRDELRSLAAWEEIFGKQFMSLLVFAYNVVGDRAPLPPDELFAFRGGLYGFVGIRLDHYASHAQTLSPKWDTVYLPTAQFRALACGTRTFFRPAIRSASA
jgi:hypothetical protein